MRLSRTLAVYIGRHFAAWCAGTYAALLSLVALLEVIELLRRVASRDIGAGLVLKMAMLKLPLMAMEITPFALLLGGMLAFAHLTRTHELIIVRGSGISVWQFLIPPLAIAFLTGCFMVAIFNPLASATALRFEHLESIHLKGKSSLIRVSENGLWLRQADANGQSVIHANQLNSENMALTDVIIFRFNPAGQFIERKDADDAVLNLNHWSLKNVWTTAPNKSPTFTEIDEMPTRLTSEKIQDSFASPKTMSFWTLPAFIQSMKGAGFSALKHRLHWYNLLAQPFLLCAMVLIAATFSMRMTRRGGVALVAVGGIILGFLFHFLADVVYALGLAGSLPVLLAAWAPVAIISLLGLASLMHLEDG